jgi:hypothetical protein
MYFRLVFIVSNSYEILLSSVSVLHCLSDREVPQDFQDLSINFIQKLSTTLYGARSHTVLPSTTQTVSFLRKHMHGIVTNKQRLLYREAVIAMTRTRLYVCVVVYAEGACDMSCNINAA